MSAAEAALAGPLGAAAVVAVMALATALCRFGGIALMSVLRVTPRVEAALGALPGSIVAATVAPIAIGSGPAAVAGVVAAVLGARFLRNELAALLCGMAVAAGIRALGLDAT